MDTEELITAQIEYYRARAAQYDGEIARALAKSPEYIERFGADMAVIDDWLAADPPTGHVLEIAAGSGNRTAQILRSADRVTAVDAAPEMLALLRSKHPDVEIIEADIFRWEPSSRYDNVFFGYWLSHIPAGRWEAFWLLVHSALRPGGRAWFFDNAHPDYANATGLGDWPVVAGHRADDRIDTEVQTRKLDDGSEWSMVKRFWWPDELQRDLAELGWESTVAHTSFALIYGTAWHG